MALCEATAANKREERKKQVILGDLPLDFLRVSPISSEQQISLDEQAALALQHQFSVASAVSGRLTVTVIEAKLNKNYGLTRMDPYVRLRIGNSVYETTTDYNGAKNPKWNRVFNCFYISNDATIDIEIFDECAFHLDERIAWGTYTIADHIIKGETVNEWIELSGKLGDGKEGSINLSISCYPIPTGTLIYHPQSMVTVIPYGQNKTDGSQSDTTIAMPNVKIDPLSGNAHLPKPQVTLCRTSEDDLKQVLEMFPNMDEEVVKEVMENNQGNKDLTINVLLELSET